MKGFFTKEQTKSQSRPDGRSYSCASCGLYQYVLSPRMEPFGNFKKDILNIGESPGEIEDEKGKQWQGKMGQALRRQYKKCGIDLFEDCLNINAINCRATDNKGRNRAPTDYEIACCRKQVLQVIEQYKPRIIMLLGNAAIKSLIGYRWKKDLGGITKWRGWTIPDRDFNAWICPVFHPSYVDRQRGFKEVTTIWKQDLQSAFKLIGEPVPVFEDERQQIEYINEDSLEEFFNRLSGMNKRITTFDYEATGLKPHAKGHRIVCCAIADESNHAWAFMMPKKKWLRNLFVKNYLLNENIGKVAANIKFEQNWSAVRLGTEVSPWIFDTMQAAHILDNRPGITGLKFQTYINFGVIDYDSEISSYLEGVDKKNANSLNRIYEFIKKYGEKKVLEYCGLDALYEHKLALKQINSLGGQVRRF